MPAEDGDDESESFSNFGAEPGFVPVQQQPFAPREQHREQPRDAQPYQPREQHYQQPRDNNYPPRENNQREHRPQPQFQPQPQPAMPVGDSVDRLPSFITGPQPQVNGAGFEPNGAGGERFPPRRRRRPHGPRPEGVAAPATPGDDFNPGNE
jgi:hypothetical protein